MQERETKERDCLSFEGFCACVRIDMGHRLGNAEVAVREVMKVNDVKKAGLVIREEGKGDVLPTIYLEEFYEEYLHGRSLGQIEEEIITAYRMGCPVCPPDVSPFRDWVKERIVFRLASMELNREYLKDIPHFPCLDLAVTFHCLLESEELGNASIAIHDSHLEMWGISREELYATAMENTPKLLPPVIQSLSEVIKEITGIQEGAGEMHPPMYVLSNQKKIFGSACILYKGVLGEFADRLGTDLHILPSSCHEVLLIPAAGKMDTRELDEMVRAVNMTQLSPEEILSDHVYRFDRETGKVTMQEEKE